MQTNNLNNKAIYWEQIAKNPSKLRLLRSPSSPIEGTTTATTTTTNSSWGIPFNQSLRHPSQQSVGLHTAWKSASPSRRLTTKQPKRMPKFKIHYLNLRGRAESIRLLLNYVQQPFEDFRENFLEFTKAKDKLPLPHLPKLTVDGQFEICYTSVILAYLGEKFGLESDTAEEKALCMQLAQRINDHFEYIKPFLPVLAEQCFWPCIIEDFGAVFERQLEINNTGYLVGDKITWIDFYAASFSDLALTYGREDMLDRFPRVLHHCRAVHSLPQLQQHIKTRPDTLF
uniref:Glutathione S-transferase n=1 Tax=Meloidogyne incognita TaxID=6306 RepID=A0A914KJA0_MELIC